MVYLIYLLFSFLYLKAFRLRRDTLSRLMLVSFPVIVFWIIIIGGQYDVGTDYSAYYIHFNSNSEQLFYDRGEYLFGYLIYYCHTLNIYGQGIFFVISAIWILVLIPISYYSLNSSSRYFYLFFFIFVVFPTTFNNQMNGIRQYTAVYFFTIAIILLYYKKYSFSAISFVVSVLFHKSALAAIGLFVILFVILLFDEKIKRKYLVASVFCGVVAGIFLIRSSSMSSILVHFQDVEEMEYYLDYYSRHERDGNIVFMLSKYYYLPIIFECIYRLPKMHLSNIEYKFYYLGIISFVIRIAIVAVPYVGRTSGYFEILSCIPLAYLMIYYHKYRKKNYYNLSLIYLLLPFLLKVTFFAVGEYSYHSYFLL